MRRFGSDKPDLRNPLELVDVADLVAGCDFKVFAGPAKDPKGRVAALRVPGGGAMPRSQIDEYTAYVARYGAKGLAYIKVNETAKGRDGLQSPIIKFLSDDAVKGILERTGANDGDLMFFGADSAKVVSDAIGALRLKVGVDLKLAATGWKPLWVVDFPMFEWDPDEKRWVAMHHPFTSPVNDDIAALKAAPDKALAKAYDLVLNGSEIARRLGAYLPPGHAVRPCSTCWASTPRKRSSSSASCSTRSSTARRRMAASRSASTASSCTWPAPTASATSSHSRRRRPPRTRSPMRRPKYRRSSCASCTSGCARHRRQPNGDTT